MSPTLPFLAGFLLALYGCRARSLSGLLLATWILSFQLGLPGAVLGALLGVATAGTLWASLWVAAGIAVAGGLSPGLAIAAVPPLWLSVEGLSQSGRCRIAGASLILLAVLCVVGG